MRLTRVLLRQAVPHRYYALQEHLWYQPIEIPTTTTTTTTTAATTTTAVASTSMVTQQHQQEFHQMAYDYCIQIGITKQGLDHLGDITAIKQQQQQHVRQSEESLMSDASSSSSSSLPLSQTRAVVQGQDIVHIHWEGYERSGADELYHSVWNTIEGTKTIASPVTGHLLLGVVDTISQQDTYVDEDTVVANVICSRQELEEATKGWTNEQDYQYAVERQEPGMFAETA